MGDDSFWATEEERRNPRGPQPPARSDSAEREEHARARQHQSEMALRFVHSGRAWWLVAVLIPAYSIFCFNGLRTGWPFFMNMPSWLWLPLCAVTAGWSVFGLARFETAVRLNERMNRPFRAFDARLAPEMESLIGFVVLAAAGVGTLVGYGTWAALAWLAH